MRGSAGLTQRLIGSSCGRTSTTSHSSQSIQTISLNRGTLPISSSHLPTHLSNTQQTYSGIVNSRLNSVRSLSTSAATEPLSSTVISGDPEDDHTLGSKYQKKTQREHILLRPEPYLGAIDPVTDKQWVLTCPFTEEHVNTELNTLNPSTPRVVESDITYNPALYKIFDEILVNAADNVHRNTRKYKMTYVDVHIDPVNNRISVENNGASIPIVTHPQEQVYVPELIFGHLLTSSNYDDNVSRFTGGRHGFGAKLTNIFSTSFCVEVLDQDRKLFYHQEFSDNMSNIHPPTLSPASAYVHPHAALRQSKENNLTRISFSPDLSRFPGIDTLDSSMLRLMHRRVVDLAASLGKHNVSVYLNGVLIPVHNFHDYLRLCPIFIGKGCADDTPVLAISGKNGLLNPENAEISEVEDTSASEDPELEVDEEEEDANTLTSKGTMITAELSPQWFIAIAPRHDNDPHTFSSLRHLSFVNNIATCRGGTHVNYITDIIARYICTYINDPKRKKKWNVTADVNIGQVKSRMAMLVACYLPNPTFDSQTKDLLMTPIRPPGAGNFQNTNSGKANVEGITIPESLLKKICKQSGIIPLVVDYLQDKETRELQKKMSSTRTRVKDKTKFLTIEKLEDAHWAGSDRSHLCTLILTEGDSAKALALSGLDILGRERYGVYPLKGKMLNVRDVSKAQVHNNKELQEIVQILGLKYGADYSSIFDKKTGTIMSAAGTEGLRYGSVMVMADQDHDGSHIKGLLLNVFHCLWPSLLKVPHFIKQFVTPIVKATWTGQGPMMVPKELNVVDAVTPGTGSSGKHGYGKNRGFPHKSEEQHSGSVTSSSASASTQSHDTHASNNSVIDSASVTASIIRNHRTLSFYSLRDYQAWRALTPPDMLTKYRVKYYKGLGTSTSVEGREYFSQLQTHVIDFVWGGKEDDKALVLAFSKELADARKAWLKQVDADETEVEMEVEGKEEGLLLSDVEESVVDVQGTVEVQSSKSSTSPSISSSSLSTVGQSGHKQVSVSNFVHHELIHFSHADNIRSIPSLVDGLKPGQRKVLFACLKRNLTREIKVAQLSGYVSEHTGYHHGEQSLNSTIVGMAQQYPFSNNLALLQPIGQFGTRAMGGKDSASARYIFTKLSAVTRKIFREDDEVILKYNNDDGVVVEPKVYYPILPFVLVNGANGIGTGYSTTIASYHPVDLITRIRQYLDQTPMNNLVPWAWGYTGQIVPECQIPDPEFPDGIIPKFISRGKIHIDSNKNCLHVTELPWGVWTSNYKQFLISLLDGQKDREKEREKNAKTAKISTAITTKTVGSPVGLSAGGKTPTLLSFTEHHAENTVSFKLFFRKDEFQQVISSPTIYEMLKLTTNINTGNMHLFDHNGQIQLYNDPRQIIKNFAEIRLAAYASRRAAQLRQLQVQIAVAAAKSRFVMEVAEEGRKLGKKKKEELVLELFEAGFMPYLPSRADTEGEGTDAEADGMNHGDTPSSSSFTSSALGKHVNGSGSSGGGKYIEIPSHINIRDIVDTYNIDEDNYHILGLKKIFRNEKSGKSLISQYRDAFAEAGVSTSSLRLSVNSYDYLLNMSLFSLTMERVAALEREKREFIAKHDMLFHSTPETMWRAELDDLEAYLLNTLRIPSNDNDLLVLKQREEKEKEKERERLAAEAVQKGKKRGHSGNSGSGSGNNNDNHAKKAPSSSSQPQKSKQTPQSPRADAASLTSTRKPKTLQNIASEAKTAVKMMAKSK